MYEQASERWSPVQSVEKVILSVMSMRSEDRPWYVGESKQRGVGGLLREQLLPPLFVSFSRLREAHRVLVGTAQAPLFFCCLLEAAGFLPAGALFCFAGCFGCFLAFCLGVFGGVGSSI